MSTFDILLNIESAKVDAIREQSKILKENTEKDIKARNRVDISLEEYERMKKEIKTLTFENSRMMGFLDKIKIPMDEHIIESTIEKSVYENRMTFRKQYVIHFEAYEP